MLKARAEARREGDENKTPVEHLLLDLRIATSVTRRARGRLRRGALDDASASERQEVQSACGEASAQMELLQRRMHGELGDAG
jgi:hypothetical protein